jgi:ABC-type amino acid transport substrate-binding protein
VRYSLLTVGATAVTLATVGAVLRATGVGAYDKDQVALAMRPLHPPRVQAVVLTELPKEPPASPRDGASVAEAVRERGRLRVGHIDGAMPYSFVNSRGELVGFDVEMAYVLADEMGVGLDFVPVARDRMAEILDEGLCDVVMSGVALTTRRGSRMAFSANYIDETLAFLVPDYRRADFSSAEWIRSTPGLKVAVPDIPYLLGLIQREFPDVAALPMPLDAARPADYLQVRGERVDALAETAERGSFLTLLHPEYSVAIPHPVILKIPLAYPVARHDVEFARFLSNWIDLKQKDGTIPALYNHWILGQDARPRHPHWSILHDVLHWAR